MIDAVVIESLDSVQRATVQHALAVLSLSGVYDLQIQLVKDQLMFGPVDEPVESLTDKVLEARRKIHALNSMKYIGDQLKEILE